MEVKKRDSDSAYAKTDEERAFPPPPKLVLKIDTHAIKPVQFSGGKTTTEELSGRLKKTEDRNPDSAIESYGSPDSKKVSSNGSKIQCKRCENWFYEDDFQSHMTMHSTQILDWLYLGGYRNSTNYKELTLRTNISYILNASIECENSFPKEFVYKKYELEDNSEQDISKYFEEACEFLEEARKKSKNTLVHCIQGISRSTSFVIAYLILKQNMTLREAYNFVLSKRSIIKPNPGFMSQLIKLDVRVHGISSMTQEEEIY